MTHRGLLGDWFRQAVDACHPRTVLPPLLPDGGPMGSNIVLGAGKAAAAMAAVAHARLEGPTKGLVVTRYGHTTTETTGDIEVVEASHPVPDDSSVNSATRMLACAASARPDDRVLFIFSGGGSALLCSPIDGISVDKKREVTGFLLQSGAPIEEINLVRKHLSRIKGGGLASRVTEAEMHTIAISDVIGDDPSDIASGPSIGITRDPAAAVAVLEKYGYAQTGSIKAALEAGGQLSVREHPVALAATAQTALDATARQARVSGWTPVVIGADISGDAADIGGRHAELARSYQQKGGRHALISGGELTVRVANPNGRGGPNLEYLASLALALDGAPGIEALACDSDGIDGTEDNAGGYIGPDTLKRAHDAGVDFAALLGDNRCYDGFQALDDLIMTGPTLTNVNDIRIILVDGEKAVTA